MSDEIALLTADVFETAGALRRLGERTAHTEGLTQARWQVLSVVSETPLTVPQAARRLGVSRQNVQRVANDLVTLKHAVYETNPDHRGSPLLALSAHGREALSKLTARAETVNSTLAQALPQDGAATARALLRQLLTELDRLEGQDGRQSDSES
ncbi:MarR family transcriptional regulator [Actinomadura sp. 7K507]|uniref:MarR family winged helix-turn-helix transcriptional regulator n=1 Tax=Actinomadura sp. 7K507 TaxID=2530365 RepID=UPI00104BAB94|nr:MarR family transcriptional regulator [Actinomadura sp. 7K507]TDC94556.1 MarR family transcriptional regulator [Actinomadura sp. 7K507]